MHYINNTAITLVDVNGGKGNTFGSKTNFILGYLNKPTDKFK
jgi:hypothetical protein